MLLPLLVQAALAAGPSASSTLSGSAGRMTADLAFDGLLSSGWAEGDVGSGEGQWLELDLGRTSRVDKVSIWPGNLADGAKSYREYSRPRTVQLVVDGEKLGDPVRLQDEIQRLDLEVGRDARRIRVEVVDTYEGIVFQDLYIAEVAVNYPDNSQASRFDQYLQSRDAQRKAEAFNEELEAAYARHKDAEFGDKEAFTFVTDAVADGPAFLRPVIQRTVPAGYRAQAVRSSARAQKALRKLLDPNGIAALELAALRAMDQEQWELRDLVDRFYAYQELKGGPSRNVGYWGEPGWAPGQIKGLGEPIAIETDRYGAVYIADTANNRLQHFSEEGRPDRVLGPSPDIASAWFARGRKWYVSGSKPGEDAGQWTNPVDVELIPQKETDWVAGLDAKGRVQIFDEEGRLRIGWRVETGNEAEAGLGGTAYLEYIPKTGLLVAIIEDEAVSYTLDSEEVGRFEIKDGTPNAVEVDKKGRLLMAFGDEIVAYNPKDGFRYGTVIDDAVLGEGFEDVDLAMDEEDRLWVLTDMGWAFRFKKPGKLDYKLKVIDRPIKHPRIAVNQGILFLTSDDRIERLDVLQIKLDQEQAARDAEEGAE